MSDIANNVDSAIKTLAQAVSAANLTLDGYVSSYTASGVGMLADAVNLGSTGTPYYDKSQSVPVPDAIGTAPTTPLTSTTLATVAAYPDLVIETLPPYPTTANAALNAIVVPTFAPLESAPSLNPVWTEAFWVNLKALLSESLTACDATNVDTLVTTLSSETERLQVALFAADRERKGQTLRDLYSAANATTGARGFSYPNSMTLALKLDAQQKYQFDLTQTARDLIKLIFEWAKNNYQFTLPQAANTHQADTEFNLKYAAALLQTYVEQTRLILDETKAKVEVALAQADFAVKEYNVKVETLLKKYSTRTETIMRAQVSENSSKFQGYTAGEELKLKVTAANHETYKLKASILDMGDRNSLSYYATRVSNYLGSASATIQATTSNATNKLNAAEAMVRNASALASTSQQIAIGTYTAAAAVV